MLSLLWYAYIFFFFNDTATTEIYTLSLHDALPIFEDLHQFARRRAGSGGGESDCNGGSRLQGLDRAFFAPATQDQLVWICSNFATPVCDLTFVAFHVHIKLRMRICKSEFRYSSLNGCRFRSVIRNIRSVVCEQRNTKPENCRDHERRNPLFILHMKNPH